MPRLVLLLLAGALGAGFSTAAAASECQYRYRFRGGTTTQGALMVNSGTYCESQIRLGRLARRSYQAQVTRIEGVTIAGPAAHGSARVVGNRFAYQSAPGYRGQDQFTVVLALRSDRGPSRARVNIDVDVH